MRIDLIICPDHIEDKIESEHHVKAEEARQVLLGKPRIRFAEKGYIEGDDVFGAFGRTHAGRYLSVFFGNYSAIKQGLKKVVGEKRFAELGEY